jgi:carbonic anhydrase
MDNKKFLEMIESAFKKYLETSARSNEKLKILHGAIADDLQTNLGKGFSIQSLGFEHGKETEIAGRYLPKKVDIVISKGKDILCGVAVKFVMSNYKQNSNNYFENMLGETANIRTANKGYFQILVLPKKLPYFEKDGRI